MKLSEAKKDQYIMRINSNTIKRICKVNLKSVTPYNSITITEKELEDYIIVDEAMCKIETIKRLINNECRCVEHLISNLNDASRTIDLFSENNNKYTNININIDSDQIKNDIYKLIDDIRKDFEELKNGN